MVRALKLTLARRGTHGFPWRYALVALLLVALTGFVLSRYVVAASFAALYSVLLVFLGRSGGALHRQRRPSEDYSQDQGEITDAIVNSLATSLRVRDNVTGRHTLRVQRLAVALARHMGLTGHQLQALTQAALLHDIGKIGVPDAVLNKLGPLTDDEWWYMRRHPALGYGILRHLPLLKGVASIVYAHHEHYDGRGYPHGLKGEEIPPEARLFAVIDAYDAMTSNRPYRQALPQGQAVAEIVHYAGTQFDPGMVQAFVEAAALRVIGLADMGPHGNGRGEGDLERMAPYAPSA
ncbi:MAG: HD-GYP domain-containing protein [Dehalococcoidia bacterium]